MSIKTFALSLLLGVALAHPLASPVEAPIADAIVERAPASTSASGTTSSQVSCPGSNGATFTASNGQSFIIECGSDRPGNINMVYTANFATCIDACAAYSGCVDVSYVSNNAGACYMKSSIGTANTGNSAVWGARLASSTSTTAASTVATSTTLKTSSTVATSTTLKTSSTLAATSTTVAATTTTASATTVIGTGKRGLAYNTVSLTSFFTSAPQVDWGYNWGQQANGLPSKFEFVPMLWSNTASYTNSWNANAKAAIAAGSKYLLGFNEPDLSSQSNISPAAAAASWMTYMQPFAGQAKLVSPAVTNGGGESGLQWTKEFLGNCTACTVDVIALHWYSNYGPDFQNHVTQANTMFGKPVWVTEFGLTSATDADIATFLTTNLAWLDSQSFVQRYAYFGDFEGYLVNTAGTALSTYGTVYAS